MESVYATEIIKENFACYQAYDGPMRPAKQADFTYG